jgi:threonine dehydrogenase-like Zn-dependent dehydrogenase
VLVLSLALGVCATDRKILSGAHGWAPPGATRLVIGHGPVGRVRQVGGLGVPGRTFRIDLGKH